MSKIRIYELAKTLNRSNKEVLDAASALGMDVTNHMSGVTEREVKQIEGRFMRKKAEDSGEKSPKNISDKSAGGQSEPPKHKKSKKIIFDRTQEIRNEERQKGKTSTKGTRTYSSDHPNQYVKRGSSSQSESRDTRGSGSSGSGGQRSYREGDRKRPSGQSAPQGSNRQGYSAGSQKSGTSAQRSSGGNADRRPSSSGTSGDKNRYDNRPSRPSGASGPSRSSRPSGTTRPSGSSYASKDRPRQGHSGGSEGGYDRKPGMKPGRKPSAPKKEFAGEEIQEKTPKKKKPRKDKIVVTFDRDKLEKKSQKAKKIKKDAIKAGDGVKRREFDFGKKVKQKGVKYKEKSEKERSERLDERLKREKVYIPAEMTVKEFAEVINKSSNDIIVKLMGMGHMMTLNAILDYETAALIAMDYNIDLEVEEVEAENHIEAYDLEYDDAPKDLVKRAPVVTVMGHVDHGKTSLLDAIRNTGIAEGEAGGITQHIGASEVMHKNEKIVFLDTPGHEAFTSLRARGAQVTDVSILVVAADDGVMPQTIEAIDHSKAAGVPIIVAINKMDKPGANPDRVKQELSERGVIVEEWGGDVIAVPVSAKTGEGIETLLEMVLLVSEVLELKANPNRPGIGTVVEAKMVKGRGVVATIILEKGRMAIGDPVVAGVAYGRIKAMYSHKGKKIKEIGPSSTVEIDGFSDMPHAGDKIYVTPDDRTAHIIAEKQAVDFREKTLNKNRGVSLEDLFSRIKEGEIKDLNIVLKADVHGSVEALKQSLSKISNEEVRVNVIRADVGTISESDVILASASNAIIIGFNVRPSTNVTSLAEQEGVDMRTYQIIYNAINDVETAMKGMLDPTFKEVILGRAEVRATFKIPSGMIAGSYVTSGKIARNAQVRVIREGIVLFEGKIASLKRFKDDAKEVEKGFECGIGIERFNDLKEGDELEAFVMEEVKR